jgi:uncharacterized membrane protein
MNISNTLVLVIFFSIVAFLLLAFIGYVIYILKKDHDKKIKRSSLPPASPPPASPTEEKQPQGQGNLFRAILEEAKNKPEPDVNEIRAELARIEAEESGGRPAEEPEQGQG